MSHPPKTSPETAANLLAVKARELAGRARWLASEPTMDPSFVLAMVEESASGVAFWVEQLKKTIAK